MNQEIILKAKLYDANEQIAVLSQADRDKTNALQEIVALLGLHGETNILLQDIVDAVAAIVPEESTEKRNQLMEDLYAEPEVN